MCDLSKENRQSQRQLKQTLTVVSHSSTYSYLITKGEPKTNFIKTSNKGSLRKVEVPLFMFVVKLNRETQSWKILFNINILISKRVILVVYFLISTRLRRLCGFKTLSLKVIFFFFFF